MVDSAAERNARWRAKKNAEITSLETELNAIRAQLNLPPISFTLEHSLPFKGGRRPWYNPPEGLTKLQLEQWRREERKKRKAIKQRENRMRKSALLKEMKQQLSELNRKIEEKMSMEVQADGTLLGLSMNHESTVGPCDHTEETLEVDPYIENDVDSAPWMNGEIVASADEIANVFDNDVEGLD
jgi:hypothetical protein